MLGRPVSLAACAAPLPSANNSTAIAVRCAAKDGKAAAAEPESSSHGHTGPRVVNRRLILGGLAAGMAAVVGCPICDSNGVSSIGAALAADSSKADDSGPMEWGELCSAADAAQSATGGQLNAVSKLTRDNSLGNITFAYKNADASFLNTGHGTMQVNFPSGSNTCAVGGRQLQLLQYHFHAPSEHSFNGVRCPMEAHLVHRDADGKLAVIGVMIEADPRAPRNLCLEAALAFAPSEKKKQMQGEGGREGQVQQSNERNMCLEAAPAFAPGEKKKQMCVTGVEWAALAFAPSEKKEAVVSGWRGGSGRSGGSGTGMSDRGEQQCGHAQCPSSTTRNPRRARTTSRGRRGGSGGSGAGVSDRRKQQYGHGGTHSARSPQPLSGPCVSQAGHLLPFPLFPCPPSEVSGGGGGGQGQVPAALSCTTPYFPLSLLPPHSLFPPLKCARPGVFGGAGGGHEKCGPSGVSGGAGGGQGGARSALQQCLRVQTSPQPLLPPTDRPDASQAYIHYQGSLADPACSDVVDWFVLATPLKVPDSQVLEFLSFVGDRRTLAFNSRPRQDLGPRRLAVGPA
ncbi:unnamed protein product [Closterium sp. Yama58-4]|nr:unnamed protein product [Closterium sp. Yama58-4]